LDVFNRLYSVTRPLGHYYLRSLRSLNPSLVDASHIADSSVMDTLPHDTRQWMPAYALTMEVATTLLLGTRLYSRLRHAAGSPGLDDVFITLSWITSTVSIALIIEGKVLSIF
jgi:hypothetical protein